MDLLTVGNTTFTGDQRVRVTLRHPTDWALVIQQVPGRVGTPVLCQVRPEDAGRYLCSLETLPKQSLVLLLQVNGEARDLPAVVINMISLLISL
jgi:hypothetical protein